MIIIITIIIIIATIIIYWFFFIFFILRFFVCELRIATPVAMLNEREKKNVSRTMLSSYLGFILVVQSWKSVEKVLVFFLRTIRGLKTKKKKPKKNFEKKETLIISYFNEKPSMVNY